MAVLVGGVGVVRGQFGSCRRFGDDPMGGPEGWWGVYVGGRRVLVGVPGTRVIGVGPRPWTLTSFPPPSFPCLPLPPPLTHRLLSLVLSSSLLFPLLIPILLPPLTSLSPSTLSLPPLPLSPIHLVSSSLPPPTILPSSPHPYRSSVCISSSSAPSSSTTRLLVTSFSFSFLSRLLSHKPSPPASSLSPSFTTHSSPSSAIFLSYFSPSPPVSLPSSPPTLSSPRPRPPLAPHPYLLTPLLMSSSPFPRSPAPSSSSSSLPLQSLLTSPSPLPSSSTLFLYLFPSLLHLLFSTSRLPLPLPSLLSSSTCPSSRFIRSLPNPPHSFPLRPPAGTHGWGPPLGGVGWGLWVVLGFFVFGVGGGGGVLGGVVVLGANQAEIELLGGGV
uniref:Uncharacterized protein n=1 Tax=Knipowitschia caucasica TaxID=637954 RepID=A0AAV2MKG8_KNICA